MGDCLLKTSGAKLIVDALNDGHDNLEELHMDSNEIIGVEGGKAVVEMAAAKPNMRSLNLDANSFGEAGCEKIYQLLENAGKSDIMEPFEDDEEPDGESDQEV